MKKIIKFLYPYIKPHMNLVIGSLLLSFCLAGIKGAQAYLVKPIFDKGLAADSSFDEALRYAFILLALGIANFPSRFFHFYWIRYVVDKATCALRMKIYAKLQALPMSYFSKNKGGELLSSVLNDTQVLSQGFRASIDIIREPLTAIIMLGLALYRDWQLTLVIFAVTPLFILIFGKSGKRVRNSQGQAQEYMADMTHNLGEGLQGQKISKAFNLQTYIVERFEKAQDRYFRFLMKTTKTEEIAHPLVEFVGAIAFSGVILFAHHRISTGVMSTGDFISFVTALALLMDPIRKYSQANVKLNQARAAGERILNVLSLDNEKDSGEKELEGFQSKIEFKNVSFSYGEGKVLRNFNLTINKGEKVALVGLSGSGKSTLINLLMRLYEIEEGEILVDGINIKDLTLKNLRSMFGLVSQDIFLFNDTIKENLQLGEIYSEQQIAEALKISHAAEFINSLPEKTETIIGDRGTRLSGGQAQRITIARAYLKNPPILLFDEATSALDNESEKIVQKALDDMSTGNTVIAVAHRLSTIQNFDKIIVMKEGEKIQEGLHRDLIQGGGEYQKLYELSLQ